MSTTPEEMTVIYFVWDLLSCHQTSVKNKVKCGYLPLCQADEKKKSSLVSVVNKSQYHDTHSDTIGNV